MGNLGRRITRIYYEWPLGTTLVCEIVMVWIGVALLLDPLLPTIPDASPWHQWGSGGELVLGAVFVALGTYGALYRERQTGLIPTFLLVGLGLLQSIHPFNVIGFAFYTVFLAGGIKDAYERRSRAKLRREWRIMVPRGDDP